MLPTLTPSEKPCLEVRLYKVHGTKQSISFIDNNREETASIATNDENEINYCNFLKRENSKSYSNFVSLIERLKKVRHPSIARYLDYQASSVGEDFLYIVSESYDENLLDLIMLRKNEDLSFKETELIRIAYNVLEGLNYLETNSYSDSFVLKPEDLVIDTKGNVKISFFGLNKYQSLQNLFTSPNILFLPPEAFLLSEADILASNFGFKGEIWGLGMLLLICLTINDKSSYGYKIMQDLEGNMHQDFTKEFLKLLPKYKDKSIFAKFPYITPFENELEKWLFGLDVKTTDVQLRDFISKCLEPNFKRRFSPYDLIRHPVFSRYRESLKTARYYPCIYTNNDPNRPLLKELAATIRSKGDFSIGKENIMDYFSWEDMLYLWSKTNRDFEIYFKDSFCKSFINSKKSFYRRKELLSKDFDAKRPLIFEYSTKQQFSISYIQEGLIEYFQKHKNRIRKEKEKMEEILIKKSSISDKVSATSLKSGAVTEGKSIKNFFSNFMLEKTPSKSSYSVDKASTEDQKEIEEDENEVDQRNKNLYEAIEDLWKTTSFLFNMKDESALLFSEVPSSLLKEYFMKVLGVCKDKENVADILNLDNSLNEKNNLKCLIQIENDIPRSHQYSYLMNSFYGKKHIYKLLASWLNMNSAYTYTQGLDSIAIVSSEICNWNFNTSVVLLNQILSKFFPNIANHNENLSHIKTRICLIEWIMAFFEPSLALHLRRIGFTSEIFAIPWIVTLYSSIFTIEKVIKVWEKMIIIEDFQYFFAASILCDLKSKLLLMDLNECLSCIKSLEGIIDIDNCIRFSVLMSCCLLKNFLTINYCKEKENENQYKNEFYSTRPWEIPLSPSEVSSQKVFHISVFEMVALTKKPFIMDIRSEKEFEEISIINSVHFKLEKETLNEIQLEYLELKTKQFLSFDSLSDTEFSDQKASEYNLKMFPIVIIDNYESKALDSVIDVLLENDVRGFCVLKGGIQAVKIDAREILQEKVKPTNISQLKKEIKVMQQQQLQKV